MHPEIVVTWAMVPPGILSMAYQSRVHRKCSFLLLCSMVCSKRADIAIHLRTEKIYSCGRWKGIFTSNLGWRISTYISYLFHGKNVIHERSMDKLNYVRNTRVQWNALECNGMHRESFNPLHNFQDMEIFTITHFSTNMYLYTYNIYVAQIELKVFMVSF